MNSHVATEQMLLRMYMPFINNGGLFIPEQAMGLALGDLVFLVIRLLDDPVQYATNCRVVWATPGCNETVPANGIGLQFLGDDGRLRFAIETLLVSKIDDRSNSYTL